MLPTLQIVTLLLVALAMTPAVAHALELPGKFRLPQETYLAVQPIYYPGFTVVGGFGEFGGMLSSLSLLFVTPRETPAFWLTLSAFLALVSMHIVFWVFTQPVNKFWLKDEKLGGAGAAFFRIGARGTGGRTSDWTSMRNQWEYSHVARAVMSTAALVLLGTAIAAT